MIVGIHQPNLFPYLGYWNKMAQCDAFVFLDDAQLPRGKSYCSRVKIKLNDKEHWLTIPIIGKGELKKIYDVEIDYTKNWRRKHLGMIKSAYSKAKYYNYYVDMGILEEYTASYPLLNLFNLFSIRRIMRDILKLKTAIWTSFEMGDSNLKGLDRIINILKELKADTYISGTGEGSKRYIDPEVFKKNNIKLIWQEFEHPIYPQLGTKFIPGLSIIDLLFNCGPESLNILMGNKK